MENRIRRQDWLLIVGLALLLRLAFNFRFVTDTKHADIASMYQYSLRVARGIYYGDGVYWPPGFIFLSGALIRLFGASRYWALVRGLNSVLGALSCGFSSSIAAYVFQSRAAAMAAGLLTALYLPLIYYTGLAFSETLFIFFFLWSVLWLYRLHESRAQKDALGAGFFLGLATLTRPVTLLVPLLLLPWYWLSWERRWRLALARAGLVMLVLLLSLIPWTVRNYIETGYIVLVDMNGGVNFYIGHNEKATGTWMDLGQKTNPVILLGGSPEAGKLGYERGLEFILRHPRQELALAWRKLVWFWTKPSDWYISNYARRHYIPHLEPPIWGALALLAALACRKRWQSSLFLLLFVFYYNAIIVAFYFACRYRLVVEPIWLLLVAGGIGKIWEWMRLAH